MVRLADLLIEVLGGGVVLGPGIALVVLAARKFRAVRLNDWIAVIACVCAGVIGCAVVFMAVSFVLEARETIYRIKISDALSSQFLGVSVVLLAAMIVTFVVSASALIACLVRKISGWRLSLGAEVVLSLAYAAILFRLVMVY